MLRVFLDRFNVNPAASPSVGLVDAPAAKSAVIEWNDGGVQRAIDWAARFTSTRSPRDLINPAGRERENHITLSERTQLAPPQHHCRQKPSRRTAFRVGFARRSQKLLVPP